MTRSLIVVAIGAVLGALDGVGIFCEPNEPYRWQIFLAAILKGVLVAFLTASYIVARTRWWAAMSAGALCGLALALVIYLAKGAWKSGEAPYVLPGGLITGALIGLCTLIWAAKAT